MGQIIYVEWSFSQKMNPWEDTGESLKEMCSRLNNKSFHVSVTNFGHGFIEYGDEILETKRVFCWKWAHSQKPLSGFT
jgi:hypothetical protein